MKDCPECGEDVADDAVHCGHCGAKVDKERSEKKTMFGVGTVDADSFQSAVEEAKDADDSGGAQPSEEAAADSEETDDEGSGGFRLPTPGDTESQQSQEQSGETPVGMSTEEGDTESSPSLQSSDLPDPDKVGDGRLSGPEDDSAENVSESAAVEPGENQENQEDEEFLGETLSMESPPEVSSGGGDSEPADDAVTTDPEAERASNDQSDTDVPDGTAPTEPSDMAAPAASNPRDDLAEDQGEAEPEVPGELAPTRREVDTVDADEGEEAPEGSDEAGSGLAGESTTESVDTTNRTSPAGGDSSEPDVSDNLATGESGGPQEAVETETGSEAEPTPRTSAGSRFEGAGDTSPPVKSEGDAGEDSGRISTKSLLIIAGVLFGLCFVACAGVVGLWMAGVL